MNRISLKYRIALVIIMLEAAVVSLVLWRSHRVSYDEIISKLHENEDIYVHLLSDLGRDALVTMEYGELQHTVDKLSDIVSINAILINDHRNVIVAGSEHGSISSTLSELKDDAISYWKSGSVSLESGDIGKVHVNFSAKRIQQAYRESVTHGLVVAAISLAAIAVAGLIIGHFLVKRLEKLKDLVGRISEGDLDVQVGISGSDEVAQLGNSFNSMTQKIKLSIEELKRSKSLYHTLVENIPDCVVRYDRQHRHVFANTRTFRAYDAAEKECIGKTLREMGFDKQLCDTWEKAIDAVFETGQPQSEEFDRKDASGAATTFEWRVYPEYGPDGSIETVLGIIRNITERKEAEVRLRESQRSLQAIMDGVADPIMVVGTDYRVAMMNRAAREQAGTQHSIFCHEISHHRAAPCSGKDEPCPLEAVKASGTPVSVIHEHFDGAGKVHYIEILASPYRGPDGTLLGIIESSRDITERKRAEDEKLRLERQVLHAQKLESLGVLAGGIAHDFNNILMGIMGNASLALMRLPDDLSARERLREIEKAAQRAADLSSQMLAYSGKGKFLIGPIELNKLIGEMERLLEVSVSKKALLRYLFRENVPAFEGDATQVRQVVMNLVTNASESLNDAGGIITLSTGTAVCDRAFLDSTEEVLLAGYDAPLPEGPYVFIEVSDTGCGMDEATRRKIFDPFFTTKFTGRGLGMAAVLGILRGHRGSITIASEVGRGTTIRVLFPANGRHAPPSEEKEGAAGAEWRGEGTVLLVDDDKTVRAVGTEMLKHLGFTVLNASNGREALEVFREHTRKISAVILDLSMPEMNGEEVFNEMHRERPDLKVVLCSGYTEQDATDALAEKGLAGFLQKPYNINQLSDALRNALQ